MYCPLSIRLCNYLFTYFVCRSVLCGGSTSIFMFGYGIYFYARSRMSGFLQLSFFIGYNACICYAFFLIFGAISFRVSLLFVRHIYLNVKREWVTISSKKQHLLHYIKGELFPLESEVYTQQRHLCLNCILYWKSLGEEMSRMIENRLL
jgi:hypothetical protein